MSGSDRNMDISMAVVDESFPKVDLALRRGRHIDRDDGEWYAFLLDAQQALETFYRRFGCELVHKSDGYFYLLPTNDWLGKRQLSAAEMLVGQALALLYLDPKTVQHGGLVTRDDVLGHMASVMTTDGLMHALNPKKRRLDERVAQETVRARVADALRKLASGGFVEALGADSFRLRAALMRFAEPVRNSDSPAEALRELVRRGEVVLQAPEAAEAAEPESQPANASNATRDVDEGAEAEAELEDALAGFDDGGAAFDRAGSALDDSHEGHE